MNFNLDDESFDIHSELKVSRIINNNSNKIYTEKNYDNLYEYDLVVKDLELDLFKGFIEVEKSNYDYLGGRNWEHSFLKRKVCIYDKINKQFLPVLKNLAHKTIYIKFNKNFGLKDCICCDMSTILSFSSDYQDKTNKIYNNCVFRTNIDDERVKVGLNDCIRFIEKFFGGDIKPC